MILFGEILVQTEDLSLKKVEKSTVGLCMGCEAQAKSDRLSK